ncbi:MAG: isoprenylcysteine carboxylmethyltransferase family protein [Acidobacteria bacterium]|nr:isoprenylcysteine carboxylmethyltransferase family protein [Acidobacteriota bacterium]MBS1867408.1 isoprenylcysteine carboxylmethyltransferase family protein [Acidobacteriota bacterium]
MTVPNKDGAKVRFPPPLVFLGAIVLGVIFQRMVVPLSLVLSSGLRIGAGVLILACGLALGASARILFTRTGQSPIPWKPTPELILQGPYRFTRNPMYLGITLVVIGLGLALNNLWISLFAAPALLVVHFIAVLPEERYLAEKFGDSYRSFLAQVRRYL